MKKLSELPVLPFENQAAWARWLAKQHETSPGLWLKLAKKESNIDSVSYDEAVEVALCYGWIDGQKRAFDERFWLQKFTPRGPKSIWSKINREKAGRLIETGNMQPSGLAAIALARQDGRWDAAYDSQKSVLVPEDFRAELEKTPKAKSFFATLNSTNRYAILFRLQTAKKPETRLRRIRQFIEMLERKEKLYP